MNFDIESLFNMLIEHNPIAIWIKSTDYIVDKWSSGRCTYRISVILGILLVLFLCIQILVPTIRTNFPPETDFPLYVFSMILLLIIFSLFLISVVIGIAESYGFTTWYQTAKWITAILISILLVLFVLWLGKNLLTKVFMSSTSIDDEIVFVEKEINFGTNGEKEFLIKENINCSNHQNDRNRSRLLNNLKDSYQDYLNLCPNDPEIKIYHNNIGAGKSKNYIAIAVAVPISGEEDARESQEILRGIALAQNEWNRDENNQDFQMAIAMADYGNKDHKKEIESAQEITKSLASKQEILGIIGHFSAEIIESVAPIYLKNKLILISPTSTTKRINIDTYENSDLCLKDNNRSQTCLNSYVLRTALNDSIQAENIIKVITSQGNVAVAYEQNSVYSRSYKSIFKEKFGEYATKKENQPKSDACNLSISRHRTNPKLCLEQSIKNNEKVLLLIPTRKSKQYFDKLIQENYSSSNKLILLGSNSIYTEEFVRNGDQSHREDTKGMRVFVPWHRSTTLCQEGVNRLECKAAKLFSNRSAEDQNPEQYEPLKINWRTATAYDATIAMLNGLRISNKQCNSTMISQPPFDINKCMRNYLQEKLLSEEFKKEMKKNQKKGALDYILFDDNGDLDSSGESSEVVEVKNGNYMIYSP